MTEHPVALVTGAGRKNGIGAAVARHLGTKGMHLVLTDLCAPPPPHLLNPGAGQWQELNEVSAEIAQLGVQTLPLQVDVTNQDSVTTMVAQTRERFGRLDCLVNNAGVVFAPSPVAQMAPEAWQRTFDVNATGTFLVCRLALSLMLETAAKTGAGRIINMSSLAAVRPKPFMAAYAASKAAIIAFSQALAQELAPAGITVNALLPGDIDTSFKQWGLQLESLVRGQDYGDVAKAAVAQIPIGRLGTPLDVAALVGFLASEEASFITGEAINVSGGRELVQTSLPG